MDLFGVIFDTALEPGPSGVPSENGFTSGTLALSGISPLTFILFSFESLDNPEIGLCFCSAMLPFKVAGIDAECLVMFMIFVLCFFQAPVPSSH